jgi:hypothetical protein
MAGFKSIRPEQIPPLLLLHQLAQGRQDRGIKKDALKPAARVHFVEQASMPTIEATNDFRSLCTWSHLTQILLEPISELAVPFGTLLRCDRLDCGAKCPLVALAAGAHEVYKEICSGHGDDEVAIKPSISTGCVDGRSRTSSDIRAIPGLACTLRGMPTTAERRLIKSCQALQSRLVAQAATGFSAAGAAARTNASATASTRRSSRSLLRVTKAICRHGACGPSSTTRMGYDAKSAAAGVAPPKRPVLPPPSQRSRRSM